MNGVGREGWWGGGGCGVGVCLRLVHAYIRKLCLETTILRQVYTERSEGRRVEGNKKERKKWKLLTNLKEIIYWVILLKGKKSHWSGFKFLLLPSSLETLQNSKEGCVACPCCPAPCSSRVGMWSETGQLIYERSQSTKTDLVFLSTCATNNKHHVWWRAEINRWEWRMLCKWPL